MTYAHASASMDYALRAMLALAAAHPARITSLDLAQEHGLPPKYLSRLLTGVRHAGLVHARTGGDGGYRLSRPARTITVAEVIRAVDGPLTTIQHTESPAYTGPAEHLGKLWHTVDAAVRDLLDSITLADLLAGSLSRAPASRPTRQTSAAPTALSPT